MSNSTEAVPPYKSRDAFLDDGLRDLRLETALDCSICREPLLFNTAIVKNLSPHLAAPIALRLPHVAINEELAGFEYSESATEIQQTSTAIQINEDLQPETAVHITYCGHIFGRTCLKAWFTDFKSNRCPECNQTLFPNRHLKLYLRIPTREMSLEFANYIEHICRDAETASEIRGGLMSSWTRLLIRETAMELWRQQGYDVEYQYVDDAEAEGDNEETEAETVCNDEDYKTEEADLEESGISGCREIQ